MDGDALGELHQGCLGNGVSNLVSQRLEAGNRRGIDDGTLAARRHHRHHGPAEQERRFHIDRHDRVPLRLGGVLDRRGGERIDSGVVEENVDRPMGCKASANRPIDRRLTGGIAGDFGHCCSAQPQPRGRCRKPCAVTVNQRQAGTFGGKGPGRCRAKTGRRASDEHRGSGKAHAPTPVAGRDWP